MKRGIYLFPTLLTLGNLAAGVLAIIFSAGGHYTAAAWTIIVGIALDMSDGRVARWMNATSQFGLELDSLSDLTTFGIAPAILMYELALEPLGRPGYMIAIFFALTAALRLARFNVRTQHAVPEPISFFVGLPVPAAAGILASFVLSYELFDNAEVTVKTIPLLMKRMPMFFHMIPVTMMFLSFLMVSRVQYNDFKKLKLANPKSYQSLILILATVLLILTYPQNTIFIVFSLYVASGLIMFTWKYYRAQRDRQLSKMMRRSTDRPQQPEQHEPAPLN